MKEDENGVTLSHRIRTIWIIGIDIPHIHQMLIQEHLLPA